MRPRPSLAAKSGVGEFAARESESAQRKHPGGVGPVSFFPVQPAILFALLCFLPSHQSQESVLCELKMDAFSTLAASALVLIMTHIDDSSLPSINPSTPTILLSELDQLSLGRSVPVDAEKDPMYGGYWCVIT
jgi:hypothetical protein